MRKIFFVVATIGFASGISVMAYGEGATATTAPATQGASTQAGRVDDFSSPRATVGSFLAALRGNDLQSFRNCSVESTELGKKFMEAYSGLIVTSRKLFATAKGKFTEDAEVQKVPDPADAMEAQFKAATLEREGDTAWLMMTGQGRESAMVLRKVGADWKIDTEASYHLESDAGKKAAEGVVASGPKTTKMLEELVGEIEAGKITSLAELRERMKGKKGAGTQPAGK